MKTTKKILAGVLSASMMLGALTGCEMPFGAGSGSSDTDEALDACDSFIEALLSTNSKKIAKTLDEDGQESDYLEEIDALSSTVVADVLGEAGYEADEDSVELKKKSCSAEYEITMPDPADVADGEDVSDADDKSVTITIELELEDDEWVVTNFEDVYEELFDEELTALADGVATVTEETTEETTIETTTEATTETTTEATTETTTEATTETSADETTAETSEGETDPDETTAETSAPASVDADFEFDMKTVVFNGYTFVFGETYCKDIPDDFFGYMRDDPRATDYINDMTYTSITCAPTNHTGEFNGDYTTSYIYFCNTTGEAKVMNDCLLYEVDLKANWCKDKSLVDEGYSFNLGSGLTENSTYEDFVAFFGEPDYEYVSDEYGICEYTWGNQYSDGYSVEANFLPDGRMYEISFTGSV